MTSQQPFIVIGDKTSHGGTVIGGATTATTHGKQIARVGDKVTCPQCGRTTVIATGDSTMIVMGHPVARHGDKTACGATLIAGQMVTTSGSGGNNQKSSVVASAAAQAAARQNPEAHALGFAFTDEATGVPLRQQPVQLVVDGKATNATTDDDGHVALVYTGIKPQQVDCHILGINELMETSNG